MTTLTLNQAAARAGVSRWTISRALKAGQLQGIRDNRGRWRVEPEALDAWAAEQITVQTAPSTELHVEHHGAPEQDQAREIELAELRVGMRLLSETLIREREAAERERLAAAETANDLRRRLDEEHQERLALQRRLDAPVTVPVQATPATAGGLWAALGRWLDRASK